MMRAIEKSSYNFFARKNHTSFIKIRRDSNQFSILSAFKSLSQKLSHCIQHHQYYFYY